MTRREFFRFTTTMGGVTLLMRSREMSAESQALLAKWQEALRAGMPSSGSAPRLHFSRSELDGLRAKREALPRIWEGLRRSADQSLKAPLATHNDPALALWSDLGRARTMALVGLVDGREELWTGAWRFVEPALGPAPLAGHWVMAAHRPLRVDLGFAGMCAALACTLDWAGPHWPDEWRERAERELAARVALYREIGAAGSEWWTQATHNWRSVICGEMGIAALGVRESVPDLGDVLDISLRGVHTVLNAEGDDGSHSEGVGYWGYGIGQAAWFAFVLKRATGGAVDLFEHPYLRATGDYAVHISTPDGTCFAYEDGNPAPPNPWLCALLAAEYGKAAYQWAADRGGRSGAHASFERFLFTDPSLPADPPADYPTAHFFPDVQTAVARSGWDQRATFFGIHAGRTTVNHAHLDIGTIWLVGRGVRLVGDPGNWPYDHGQYFFNSRGPRWDYESSATIGHNTVLVNGEGQTYSPECYGEIVAHEFGTEADTFVVDGTKAYDGRLARFVRYAAFLKPDLVVLVDDIRADPPAQFQWLLHPDGELHVDDTRWTAIRDDARLTVDILGFERFAPGDGYRVALSERTTFYHDRVDAPVRRVNRVVSFETLHRLSAWVVAAVLRVDDADAPAAARGRVEKDEAGVRVNVSDGEREWVVRCDFERRSLHVRGG
jgi:hypothetical protein